MENPIHEAPGQPGTPAKWTSSSKTGLGKSLNAASDVSFTLSHGILNEVYYPREDIACIRDMELIVTDGKDFFSEEKRDTRHETNMPKTGIPAYEITNTQPDNLFTIHKEVITDPYRNTVLQRIKFDQQGKNKYHLYVLLAPHLNNEGGNNSGWLSDYNGVPMLFAKNGDFTLALACSNEYIKRSVGFVGVSDGWTDLKNHNNMEWEYTHANNGNIALTAEIDLTRNKEFVLALSFGRTKPEAANLALGSILDGFDLAKKTYIAEWEDWMNGLRKMSSKNYKISAAVLRIHESKKFPGGIIASLSIPWGETKGDSNKSGYHVVWPRDLVESAGGLRALHTEKDVVRVINYLMSTQESDGSWPQNMWLQGETYWNGIQMDQVALPIIELHRCNTLQAVDTERMKRYWPGIRKAIGYLLLNGPYTPQDRWEEESGYTVFTMATEIAALLAGADLAEINRDDELAAYCREIADYWNDIIETLTYVTDTPLAKKHGVDGYYIRINPYRDIPASELENRTMTLKNHKNGKGEIIINEHISVDALALVRFGLRSANDPKILNTLKIIDAELKVATPNGPSWHRYNNDGYGEHDNGKAYNGTGIGRAWPLLTGERGHYEVAAGHINEAKKMLAAMDNFAHNGLIPEQIWDADDIPEKNLYKGRFTGSAMPLTWAHAEYIKLCSSIEAQQIFDIPTETKSRYLDQDTKPDFFVWRFDRPIKTLKKNKTLRIAVKAAATVHWTDNNWKTKHTVETKDIGIGIHFADIKSHNKNSTELEFTFHWKTEDTWENKNFVVKIEP